MFSFLKGGQQSVEEVRAAREKIVGKEVTAFLPEDSRPFWQKWHLLQLNLLLLVPLLSSSLVGYDGAMMNAIQAIPGWKAYFGHPSSSRLGLINAIFPVGKICGLVLCTPLADRLGRRLPILVGLIIAIAGAAIQAGSVNIGMFIFARWLIGFGTACVHQPSPVLVAELAYPLHRGKMTSLYQTFYFFGAIFAAWLTYGTVNMPTAWSWRLPSLLQGAIPLAQLIFLVFVPESPRWLIANGKTEKAREIFVKYHANGDESSPLVDFEIEEIKRTLLLEQESGASEFKFKELLATQANRKRTFIAVTLGAFANWNGSGVITYYLTLLLNTIGITNGKDQSLINGLLQLFNFAVAVFVGALMVDRLGRRVLFLWGAVGCLFAYIVLTVLNAEFIKTAQHGFGIAVVVMLFVYNFHNAIAFTPLLQAYPVEIFPYALRGTGITVLYLSNWLALIFNLFVNPIAMKAISWKYYIVYIVIDVVIVAVFYFFYPETKGHTLEEITVLFEGSSAINGTPVKFSKNDEEGSSEEIGSNVEKVYEQPPKQA